MTGPTRANPAVRGRGRWIAIAAALALLAAAWSSAATTRSAAARAAAPQPVAAPAIVDVIGDDFQIEYEVDGQDLLLTFQLSNNKTGWMGVVFHEFIFPGDTILVWYDPDYQEAQAWDTYNPGIPTLPSFPAPLSDTDPTLRIPGGTPYDNVDNVEVVSSSMENGTTTIQVRRALITEDLLDFQIEPGHQFYTLALFAEGQTLSSDLLDMGDIQSYVKGADMWIIPQ